MGRTKKDKPVPTIEKQLKPEAETVKVETVIDTIAEPVEEPTKSNVIVEKVEAVKPLVVSESRVGGANSTNKVRLMKGSKLIAAAVSRQYAERLVKDNPSLSIL